MTFWCPYCGRELRPADACCPACGRDLGTFAELSYAGKLALALQHPIREVRMFAAEQLGRLGAAESVPPLAGVLEGEDDFYFLREVLVALARIHTEESRTLVRRAARHRSRLVAAVARKQLAAMDQAADARRRDPKPDHVPMQEREVSMTERNVDGGVSTQVVFARHGETALNAAGRFRGREDPPLTDCGERQARALGLALAERLPTQRPAILFASPRRRAVATAQIAGAALDLQPIILPELDDFDYGAWAGRDEVEVARTWPDLYARWRSDPGAVQFPGGESVRHAAERIAAFLRSVVAQTPDAMIRCAVCQTLMVPLATYHRVTVDLASTTGILAGPEPRALWVNEASHLGGV